MIVLPTTDPRNANFWFKRYQPPLISLQTYLYCVLQVHPKNHPLTGRKCTYTCPPFNVGFVSTKVDVAWKFHETGSVHLVQSTSRPWDTKEEQLSWLFKLPWGGRGELEHRKWRIVTYCRMWRRRHFIWRVHQNFLDDNSGEHSDDP
jgi:hypothetical protein